MTIITFYVIGLNSPMFKLVKSKSPDLPKPGDGHSTHSTIPSDPNVYIYIYIYIYIPIYDEILS